MKHKLVSKNGQMESLVVCEGMLDEGHGVVPATTSPMPKLE